MKAALDELLNVKPEDKVLRSSSPPFGVRVAYQIPIQVTIANKTKPVEALATTFEDSFVFENLALFKTIDGDGLMARFTDLADRARIALGR